MAETVDVKPDYEAHDWVENYGEYEAVFCSVNDVNSWSLEATIRGFQTNRWDEVPGHDDALIFVHPETGVSVLYDGGVVAVQQASFGDETSSTNLRSALGDLFSSLVNLGWSRTVVYHPMETMAAFLRDVGSQIPAHTDFDVVAAASLLDMANRPEAALLKEHALRLSSSASVVMDELMPVAPNAGLKNPLAGMSLSGDGGDDFLAYQQPMRPPSEAKEFAPGIDDGDLPIYRPQIPFVGKDSSPEIATFFESKTMNSPLPEAARTPLNEPITTSGNDFIALHLEIEDLTQKLVLSDQVSFAAKELAAKYSALEIEHRRLVSDLAREKGNAEDALRRMTHVEQSHRELLTTYSDLQVRHDDVAASLKDRQNALVLANDDLLVSRQNLAELSKKYVASDAIDDAQSAMTRALDSVTMVGCSAFRFDTPATPLATGETEFLMDLLDARDVVHLSPGLAGQSIRWDVFGEFDDDQPWILEQFLKAANFDRTDISRLGIDMLVLKNSQPYPQLRDLLVEPEIRAAHHVPLSSLSICSSGRAFVDLRSVSGDDLAPEMKSTFCVKEVAASDLKTLYVVHVDALDGPFVTWLVDLLRALVLSYSTSKRHERIEAVVPVAGVEVVASKEQLADELKQAVAVFGPLVEKLRLMSVPV